MILAPGFYLSDKGVAAVVVYDAVEIIVYILFEHKQIEFVKLGSVPVIIVDERKIIFHAKVVVKLGVERAVYEGVFKMFALIKRLFKPFQTVIVAQKIFADEKVSVSVRS